MGIEVAPRSIMSDELCKNRLCYLLQEMSDICMAIRLSQTVPQAIVLCESIRNHFVKPVRRALYTNIPDALALPVYDSNRNHYDVALVLKKLLASVYEPPKFASLSNTLDLLHEIIQSQPPDTLLIQILTSIWHDASSILHDHLFYWLRHASVHDPHNTFFISSQSPHTLLTENLPSFIPEVVAQKILFAGNAMKCSLQLNRHSKSTDRSTFEHVSRDAVTPLQDPIHVELAIDSFASRARLHASHQLSATLPFAHIRNRLHFLRQYLLQGDASFWRAFFSSVEKGVLRPYSETDDRTAAEKSLNQVLSTSFAELTANASHDDIRVEPFFSFRLSEEGIFYPFFTLSYPESLVLSSRAHVYCDIFSQTFAMRRASHSLRDAFINLQLLHRRLKMVPEKLSQTSRLVSTVHLYHRMTVFVNAFEWYFHAQVLQPAFDTLYQAIDNHLEEKHDTDAKPSPMSAEEKPPFFDQVNHLHENLMDQVHRDSFVGDSAVNARLDAMIATCLSLCDFINGLTVDTVREQDCNKIPRSLEVQFGRNLDLLELLLTHAQTRDRNRNIPALLLRLNYNKCASSSI